MNICENRCIHTCNPETSQVIYASHPTYPPLQKGCTSWVKKKCLPTYTPPTYPQCGGTAPLPWRMYATQELLAGAAFRFPQMLI